MNIKFKCVSSILTVVVMIITFNSCSSPDKKAWQKANEENVPISYEDYISSYPDGEFITEAKNEITNLDLERAKRINTTTSYEEFIRSHPASDYVAEIENTIDELYNERRHYLRDIKYVKIETEIGNYFQNEKIVTTQGIPLSERVASVVSALLKRAGISEINNNSNEVDIVIKVSARTEAISGAYFGAGGRYTGASSEGYISIERNNKSVAEKSFSAIISPAESIPENTFTKPSDAPFARALFSAFEPVLYRFFREEFGINCIVNSLNSPKREDREAAYEELNSISWQPKNENEKVAYLLASDDLTASNKHKEIIEMGESSVEPLIWSLTYSDYRIQDRAKEILDEIRWKPKNHKQRIILWLLESKSDKVRKMGISAVNIAIHALAEDWYRKGWAIDILIESNTKDKRAVEPLINLLNNSNYKNQAQKALRMISGEDFAGDDQLWLEWLENIKNTN